MSPLRRWNCIFSVVVSLLFVTSLQADTLKVSRSATLKEYPDISSPLVRHLAVDDTLELLATEQNNGYYHAAIEGQSGWVYRTLVRRYAAPSSVGTPTSSAVANVAPWVPEHGLILEGDIVTMDGNSTVIKGGRLVIVNNKIIAVLRPGDELPVAAVNASVIPVSGWIFPGLIDAHNHVAYNMLGLYEVDKVFDNRYQWNKGKDYQQQVNYPKRLITGNKYFDLTPEVVKYAEVKALTGGVTSIQGTPLRSENQYLVRNVEHRNFGQDRVSQHGLSIDDGRFQGGTVEKWKQQIADGELDAVILHLAEGRRDDSQSQQEFETLKLLGLLTDATVLIHCTACTAENFQEMSSAGTKVIWSPLSNLLLYGETTDIPAAVQADVLLSLGTDWSPSGSKNLLGELKIAHEIDQRRFGDVLSDEELVRMVTTNPATTLGMDDKIGSLVPGHIADVAVYAKVDQDPYRSLIKSVGMDVTLVLIDGEPLYGDLALMEQLKPQDVETMTVNAVKKGLDITNPQVKNGMQTFAEVEDLLSEATAFDMQTMWERFGQEMTFLEFQTAMDDTFKSGLVAQRLDPLFAQGDQQFFAGIAHSANAHLDFNLEQYWSRTNQGNESQLTLKLVNDPATDYELLDKTVMLDRRAARNIIDYRDGADATPGSADDKSFTTIAELDAIPYVGRSALVKMSQYAQSTYTP